jgi:8-oxo-dGTP pyrophosphatase MutT (NUDIX family)
VSELSHGPQLRARIAQHLAAFPRLTLPLELPPRESEPAVARRPAAVALALMPQPDGEATFLLTRRVRDLAHHAGQFALPGGRMDPGETPADNARRELCEELGVQLEPGAVLGLLDDFATRSGFVITPVVLWCECFCELRPNPGEVAVAYRVPLRDLYRPEVPVLHTLAETGSPLLSLPLVGTFVHSPTAAIIYQLREAALEGRTTRVHHYEQPRFAWR